MHYGEVKVFFVELSLRYYENIVLQFADGIHPDISIVVNRNDARRIRDGG